MKNKKIVFISFSIISTIFFVLLQPNISNIVSCPSYDWKYASLSEEDVQIWRKEMNHWYDLCETFNDSQDGVPLRDKVDLFLSNKNLSEENQDLSKKLSELYPNIYQLNDENLTSIILKKKAELTEAKNETTKNQPGSKEDLEISELQSELKILESNYKLLHDECLKNGYIPETYSQCLSALEEKKIILEQEYLCQMINIVYEQAERIEALEHKLNVEKSKSRNRKL